jgi:hypothetical protein
VSELSFEQKVAAIHSLKNLGNGIVWRFNTHGAPPRGGWYCYADDIEVSDGVILSGTLGHGATPEAALNDLWNQLTNLKADARVVIDAFHARRAVTWNGFMWEQFEERTKVVA